MGETTKMVTLRPYQIDLSTRAVTILKTHGLVYFAMETRTGKTLTALETARQYGAMNVLFLTKKKAIKSIQSDYKNGEFKFALTVSNYEQIHNLPMKSYDLFILDECHGLAAFPVTSLRTKRLRCCIGRLQVIFLSGTPTPESFSEMFHQLYVSYNSPWNRYNNFYHWANDGYVKIYEVERNGYMIKQYDQADAERIEKEIAPILLTYTQEAAGFCCPIEEYFLSVTDERVPQYMRQIFKEKTLTIDGHTAAAKTPATLMNKLHQIAGGTLICEDGQKERNKFTTLTISEHKAIYIKEYFKEKRIAIFYKFIAERKILDTYFPESTDSPEDFQAGKSRVFLSQICSGREGLALHSADCIVMYAIDFAAVSYFQARARIQALHRDTPAQIYWVFFAGSIEPKIYRAVSSKKNFTLRYYVKNN
jgi:hypothetical protein